MKEHIKSLFFYFFIFFSLFTFFAHFIYRTPKVVYPLKLTEQFDSNLVSLNTLDKLEAALFSKLSNTTRDTGVILDTLDNLIRNRFYHGYSTYSLGDNWLAFLIGKVLWVNLQYIVIPEDIMKHPMAACSQQGMVFQEMLNRLGIPWATTAYEPTTEHISGHYAVSAYYDGGWHYFDTNLEPKKLPGNPSVFKMIEDSSLVSVYKDRNQHFIADKIKNKAISRIKIMRYNAPNALLFHLVTLFFSNWGWLFFGIWTVVVFRYPIYYGFILKLFSKFNK